MNQEPIFIYPKDICKCGHLADEHGNLSSNPNKPWLVSCIQCGVVECSKFKKQDNLDLIERIAKQKGLI